MSDPAAQGVSVDAAKPGWKQALTKWGSALLALIATLLGAVKLMETFTLPGCDSARSLDTVRSIFKDKNLPEPTLTGVKSLTDTSAEKTCEAAYAIPNETGTLDYRVYWEGWTVKVMITKVQ